MQRRAGEICTECCFFAFYSWAYLLHRKKIMIRTYKLLLLFLSLWLPACFCSHIASAQQCIPLYDNTYNGTGNDEAKDVNYTPADKGCIVAGRTTSGTPGEYDAFLLKLDEQGGIAWSKKIGGPADDAFLRVKTLTGGGFIAIGTTRSFGNSNGEVLLAEFSAAGNLLWAKHYSNAGRNTVPKEIIELSNGDLAFAANENDSTALSNGIICRTDPTGNIIWAKTFDNGGDDGINYIMESGSMIYATGYAKGDRRDGILMQLDKATGNVTAASKFVHKLGYEDELINICKIQNGIAFGAISYNSAQDHETHELTMFRMRDDGTIVSRRKAQMFTNSGEKLGHINMLMNADSSFIYCVHDTTAYGYSRSVRFGPTGMPEWSHDFFPFGGYYDQMTGIDTTGNGLLFAGWVRSYNTNNRNRISVFKTSEEGYVGTCTPAWIGDFDDTAHYSITSFVWANFGDMNFSVSASVNAPVNDLLLTIGSVCAETKCISGPPVAPGCRATFFDHVKALRGVIMRDVCPAGNGYAVIGEYFTKISIEPLVSLVKGNGDIMWSKTYNSFAHTGLGLRSLQASDGNIVLLGSSEYVLDHGASDSSLLVKINSVTGDVIWAKYFIGDAYDIAPANDGGFVLCVNKNYGVPPIYNYAIRLNSSGDLLWQKTFAGSPEEPVFRSIIFDGDAVYLAADQYLASPNYLNTVKLNANTGDKIWSKHWLSPGRALLLQGLSKVADTLFVSVDLPSPSYNGSLHSGMLALDNDGNLLRAFELNGFELSPLSYDHKFNEHRYNNFLKTADNNFMIADGLQIPGDTSLGFIKFKGDGTVLFTRKYPNLRSHFISGIRESGGTLLLTGAKVLGVVDGLYQYESFFLKADQQGVITNTSAGECSSTIFNGAAAVPLTVTAQPTPFNTAATTDIIMKDFAAYPRPVRVWTELGCSTQANCSTLHVTGPAVMCSISDTVTYQAVRNPGCTVPVTWSIDPAIAHVVSFTDTSVRVLFLQTGNIPVGALLNTGCGVFGDTLRVQVARNAHSLYLGPDTTLCSGNTITLHAGAGFKIYQWQNGDTHDFFDVHSPGEYFVKVTDSCNNIVSDTVEVYAGSTVPISIGPDREICSNDTVHLSAPGGFLNYAWAPDYYLSAQTGQFVTVAPLADTSYFVKAEKTPGCFGIDTVHITVNHAPPVFIGGDTSICTGTSLVLDAGPGFTYYQWSNAVTGAAQTVFNDGDYSVVAVTDKGCKAYDTIRLTLYPLPNPMLDHHAGICAGTVRVLNPGSFNSYTWQDHSTAGTYIANGPGTYYVTVTDLHGCTASDTSRIVSVINNPSGFLPGDTTICSYNTLILQPARSFNRYLWNNGSSSRVITADHPGWYVLQVTDDQQCTGTDSIRIFFKDCAEGLFVPTAFTPNHDGKNDLLKAIMHGILSSFEFIVYNRYGMPIFRTTNINEGWDGKYLAEDQPAGEYIWTCKYTLAGHAAFTSQGMTLLIR